jgi:disulfide bond formation protein DsbB
LSKIQLKDFFKSPLFILLVVAEMSFFALAAALIGQLVYGLAPCQMCIYQRIPFITVIIFGVVGLFAQKAVKPLLGFSALAFLMNTGLAVYHSGIERGWWSETEGCAAHFDFSDPTLMEKIMTAQASNCTEIPWQDPFFGLSMANLNVFLCAALFMLCIYGLYLKPLLPAKS